MLDHGKTAVLVERIINKVINEKIDIDRLLIVTFTNAAAAEMRERIAERLYIELETHPELQEQIKLFSKAYITTIDSFCVRIVRDNFFKLGLDPNFKIEDQAECDILKLEALEELLEEKYSSEDEDFNELFKMYSSNKDDDKLQKLILDIYNFTRSCPYPDDWLDEKVNDFNIDTNIVNDASQIDFGKIIIDYSKTIISNAISQLKEFHAYLADTGLGSKYVDCIAEDILNLGIIIKEANTWDEMYDRLSTFKFKAASGAKGVPEDLKKKIKEQRDAAGKVIKEDLIGRFFVSNSAEIFNDYSKAYKSIKSICDIVKEFSILYDSKKFEKNILDFSDEEHYALKLLTENPNIANMYKEHFKEIMIDEYQDSNMLQEYILNQIADNNIFMVGDVKQSIYKFRHARPELFLQKYNSYSGDVESESNNKKVLLFKNFRSNQNIIDQINYVFENIMTKDLGDIDYNEDEFLKFGADYYSESNDKAELVLVEKKPSDIELDDEAMYDANQNIEGRYIAKRIKEIVGNLDIFDKKIKSYRKAMYKDIVILLRSTVNRVDYFVNELSSYNIPVYTESGGDYFNNIEVQTVMSLLRIIDNPYQDIPLVGVLRSQIGGFNVDELSSIRLVDRKVSYYEAMIKSLNLENELSNKVALFLNKLHIWREKSKYMSLWELLWALYNETGYYYYVSLFPDGVKRVANLKLLLERAERFEKSSVKGLFSFLNYIDNIKATSQDFGDSKQIGENEDVVRIMSVHKSKGLEFPIVFLAGTDKSFFTRDLKDDIIFDLDAGFGLNIIDYDTSIKYPHISKHALEIKRYLDLRSEEMRILYVALTRAREKLIVTGLVKNAEDSYKDYSRTLAKYKIDKSNCFLDWIGYTVANKSNSWKIVKVPYSSETNDIEVDEEYLLKQDYTNFDESIVSKYYSEINKQMNWVYKYESSTKLPNKVSISELKRLHQLSDEEFDNTNKQISLVPLPNFLSDDAGSGAQLGTITHEVLQRLNFSEYSINILENVVSNLTEDDQIKRYVMDKVERFSKTSLFKDICDAKQVYKETAFNLNIKASEVYNIACEDNVMIQGIIDLFYVNNDNEVILVDYKTDNVDDETILINRYKIQLDLYKRAIEEITGKKVNKSIIYSFKLNREIVI